MYILDGSIYFPNADLASPEGLLAVGGDLSMDRLLLAYRSGIFPWFNQGDPVLWWSPNPRMVLFPDELIIHKSMRPVLNKPVFQITYDQAFDRVIDACAKTVRKGEQGTWITREMKKAYIRLFEKGYAHSVEVWKDEKLVGGLYGIMMFPFFFGESMFSTVTNASKAGFITWVQKLKAEGFILIDCQMYTAHLASMGAREIDRGAFLRILKDHFKE